MTRFETGTHFPRASGSTYWRPLVDLHGLSPEELSDNPIDLRRAEFHPAGERQVAAEELMAWRNDLNDWAHDRGYPSQLNTERRSNWDVELGTRLLGDTNELPEALHPDVWCWIATNLLPHFVVYRWDWPALKNGHPPTGRSEWARFGTDLRNGLRLAMHRILTYGPDIARRASEQEFQSIQYRPAFGLDQRVARVVLETLVDAYEDPASNYGKNGGSRALDNNDVCIELRLINSLHPLCFASDDDIVAIVHDTIQRLPELRNSDNEASKSGSHERQSEQTTATETYRSSPTAKPHDTIQCLPELRNSDNEASKSGSHERQSEQTTATETYRSSPTAKLRDISAIPDGQSAWESRLHGLTGRVLIDHTRNRLQFTALDPETGTPVSTHEGPSPAVQDSVGNPPGKGKDGKFTCNGWIHLFNSAGQRLDEVAPPVEGDVR